jgi:hypothetical protein
MSKHYFTFTFEAPERDDNGPYPASKDVTMRVCYEDDTSWTSPLLDFAEFLSTIYGYDIREKIRFLDKYGVSDFRSEQYTLTDLE